MAIISDEAASIVSICLGDETFISRVVPPMSQLFFLGLLFGVEFELFIFVYSLEDLISISFSIIASSLLKTP